MTTYVAARDTLANYISAALLADKPTLAVFWENVTKADVNSVGDAFLQVEINFQDAANITINDDPIREMTGEVNFRVFYREGQGTRVALVLFDYLTSLMRLQTISGVTLNTATPGKKLQKDGWASFDLNAPFSFKSS